MNEFDIVVIGSGPGGYSCAIRCAQLGFKTALVEKYNALGGTCLNVGCIPSKALLDSSEKFYELAHYANHGIDIKGASFSFSKMVERTKGVVSKTSEGISYLMKKNKVTVLTGHASFISPFEIEVKGKETQKIKSKYFVIATGSKPSQLPGIEIDKKNIITSTEALYLEKRPDEMVVVGGGVIGLELGSVYARLGTKVTIVEYASSILATMDAELAKEMTKILKKNKNIEILTGSSVKKVESTAKGVEVFVENNADKTMKSIKANKCLMAVGRSPYTQGLGLEVIGIETDKRGAIVVSDDLQTTQPHIYAIGDVVKGAMLAHKAEEEGVSVAERIAGQKPKIHYNLIPGIVYTWPEIASVGATEEQLKEKGISYKKGKFPYIASGRARASDELDGFIKVLVHEKSDEILGVHMIGPRVADLIAQAVIAMEFKASAEDIGRCSHGHPTYSEAIKEACLDATGKRAINI